MSEQHTLAVYSTAHLTRATAARLETSEPENLPFTGGPYGPYGWFAYAHGENDGGIPHDLWLLMAHARSNGCQYLLIDCDALTVDDLPSYDW